MAPKQTLDKNAWQWAEQTNPNEVTLANIRTAYRSMLQQCPAVPGSCRKNCNGNPNCYNCLGEKAWLEKNLDEDLKEAVSESSRGMRTHGTFIGLKNLGATCYANTFLQVWYHNRDFRRGILDWTDGRKEQPNSFDERLSEHCLPPTTVLEHLQLIFALLSFSDRQYIDPSSFIECLQLDTSLQQDAQEFSKLFISLIEDQLPVKECYHGLNLIQHQFVGHYEYVTRCNGCGQQSQSGSKFYEIDLNIKGHATLDECLKEFLQEEILEGENQYFCQYCLKKQDAVRGIHLLDLPPTLNFQLLRFVFDRQTQNKKKLMSYLQFPQTLDMNAYMRNPDVAMGGERADMIYDLVSVLIHRGPGAHSGHYVAVIKDCSTPATYRFNDEEVEKLADDRFRLETEEDADGSKSSHKKPRAVKGFLSSRNAYMLVYRRRSTNPDVSAPETTLEDLSPRLQALVKMDNQKHEEALKDQLETKRFYIGKERERQEMVRNFYKIIQKARDLERNDSFEWVTTSWLRTWLAEDCMGTVPPIDNVPLLCPHEKVHPDNVSLAKLLPKEAADMIFEKFGGCLRLPCSVSMCQQCVKEKCQTIRTKAVLNEDNKMIGLLLKSKDSLQECETSYWVGKASMRRWRQMAESTLQLSSASPKEDAEHENEPENGGKDSTRNDSSKQNHVTFSPSCASTEAMVGDSLDTAAMGSTDAAAVGAAAGDAEMEEEENLLFNEDLLCSVHGNLSPDLSTRRLVPQAIWLVLKKYFPAAREFSCYSPVCHNCKTQDERVKFFKEQDKVTAAEQRQKLNDLYMEKKRPSWSRDVFQLNIVSCGFLEEWKKFIRDPLKQPPITTTDNATLLCNHGLFMYDVEQAEAQNTKYAFVWPNEWTTLMHYVTADIEIAVIRLLDEAGGERLLVKPGFCEKCCRERQQEEYSSQFTYISKAIYVRKVTEETRSKFADTLNASKSPTVTAPASDGEGITDEGDDIYFTTENGKRKHSNGGGVEKVPRLEAQSSLLPTRRSTRKGRGNDEVKFEVSSTQTLRDLKMQLVKAFSVMKLDQHLYLDGIELCDESATLEQLKIRPESVLFLQADEPSGETTFMDVSPVNSVEEGFKGTTLVGR